MTRACIPRKTPSRTLRNRALATRNIVVRCISVAATDALTGSDYRRLLVFRTEIRRFLHWSEEQAEALGMTPGKHQLLLAVRGHDDARGPTVGDVAESLLLRHHSAVGLVDRAAQDGLVRRGT